MSDRTLTLHFHPASEEPPKTGPYLILSPQIEQPRVYWWSAPLEWTRWLEGPPIYIDAFWWAEIPTDYQEWTSDE